MEAVIVLFFSFLWSTFRIVDAQVWSQVETTVHLEGNRSCGAFYCLCFLFQNCNFSTISFLLFDLAVLK